MTETNWVTGEAILWFDNDEYIYHEARRIVKQSMTNKSAGTKGDVLALKALLKSAVPDATYGVIEQFADIDWDVVIDHLIDDIKEGYE